MRRDYLKLYSPALEREMELLAFGHAGLPVVVFPSSGGSFFEYEDFGMVAALEPWLRDGGLRLYCVAGIDNESWMGEHVPLHERGWRHHLYEDWVTSQVVPLVVEESGDAGARITTTGCSFGAYHAANFALKHPGCFEHALCFSGVYDLRQLMHGHHDDWVYFNNPMEYLTHMSGSALQEVRNSTFLTLVCGRGRWEDRALPSTKAFWNLLSWKGIPNYMDLWGHDVDHDWPWWRKQVAHFMEHLVEGTLPWRPTSSA